MLWAMGFIFLFTLAGHGVVRPTPASLTLHDTYYVWPTSHVSEPGAVFAHLAGFYYWFEKMWA